MTGSLGTRVLPTTVFPSSWYGSGKLVLMVRDPGHAFVYWDLSEEQLRQTSAAVQGGLLCLRLLRAAPLALVSERTVAGASGWIALELPSPDQAYTAQLAFAGEHSSVLLASSNVAHAPPRTPRPAAASPAFVSAVQRRRALRLRLPLSTRSASAAPAPRFASTRIARIGALPRLASGAYPRGGASEAWLFGIGSESRLISFG